MTRPEHPAAAPAGLSEQELAAEGGAPLPPREQMSLVTPGAVDGTPAMEVLPDAAQGWHGNPNEPHIL
ncbi:MAG TPA: hypothetical protein VM433_10550 [Mycobacteriales bacterium]|nr:hypothetical protein [Mycobacteriales bacterium]